MKQKVLALLTFGLALVTLLIFSGTAKGGSPPLTPEPPPEPPPEYPVRASSKTAPPHWTNPYVDLPRATRQETAILPRNTGGPDNFGYEWSDEVTFLWKDTTITGTVVFSKSNGIDDGFAGPISLGFSFPFYEHRYSEVYISDNGLLSFGQGSVWNDNGTIPLDSPPDDFIAPFWDDLWVSSAISSTFTQISYSNGQDTYGQYFVVEWYQVARSGDSDSDHLLTFEAVLYANGDIFINYLTMAPAAPGVLESATVGIEDGDGIDGLTYLYNSPGITDDWAVKFTRPDPMARVKVLPAYQSRFTDKGQVEFKAHIFNIGELGSDTYTLNTGWAFGNPSWTLSLLKLDGSPLTDTGPVAQGDAFTFTVRLQAPDPDLVGDHAGFDLTATSALSPTRSATVRLVGAIPAPFAQAYMDISSGMNLERISPSGKSAFTVAGFFPGSTFAMKASELNTYLYAWEVTGSTPQDYTDIEYSVLGPFGSPIHPSSKLESNASASFPTRDLSPIWAAAPDGTIGIAWKQFQFDFGTFKERYNIFFATLSPKGEIRAGPVNVTQNSAWGGGVDEGVPKYSFPMVTATGDNRFLLMWVDEWLESGKQASDLDYAIFDTSGTKLLPAGVEPFAKFRVGTKGVERFSHPNLIQLSGNRVMVAYSEFTTSHALTYQLIDSSGNPRPEGPASIAGTEGWGPDGIQLDSGKILLAWTNPVTARIEFGMLNDGGNTLSLVPGSVTQMYNPDTRNADYVSVTKDTDGNIVLSWMESDLNQRLYYGLVSSNGSVITPSMIYHIGGGSEPLAVSSFTGQGNTPLLDGLIFLPVIMR